MNRYALAAVLIFAAGPSLAGDQSRAQCPAGSAITSGSSNVTVGGKQAARAGDATGCGSTVTEGSSNACSSTASLPPCKVRRPAAVALS